MVNAPGSSSDVAAQAVCVLRACRLQACSRGGGAGAATAAAASPLLLQPSLARAVHCRLRRCDAPTPDGDQKFYDRDRCGPVYAPRAHSTATRLVSACTGALLGTVRHRLAEGATSGKSEVARPTATSDTDHSLLAPSLTEEW
jgi:hypothetical protein